MTKRPNVRLTGEVVCQLTSRRVRGARVRGSAAICRGPSKERQARRRRRRQQGRGRPVCAPLVYALEEVQGRLGSPQGVFLSLAACVASLGWADHREPKLIRFRSQTSGSRPTAKRACLPATLRSVASTRDTTSSRGEHATCSACGKSGIRTVQAAGVAVLTVTARLRTKSSNSSPTFAVLSSMSWKSLSFCPLACVIGLISESSLASCKPHRSMR